MAEIARTSLRIRYSLLPLWYTLFEEASRTGAAVVRPLFYEFYNDANTLALDRQFLLGCAARPGRRRTRCWPGG